MSVATPTGLRRPRLLAAGLLACALALLASIVASLVVGALPLTPGTVLRELVAQGDSEASLVVWEVRLPRTAIAICVGAALALAGVLMQALTRNPLADPGLLGVNAGAAAAVVVGILAGVTGQRGHLMLALLGAGVAAGLVTVVGGTRGPGTAEDGRLVLAGAAVGACLTGVVAGVTLLNQTAFDRYRFWAVGSLADQPLSALLTAAPALLAGLAVTVAVIRPLDVLRFGDDSGAALGVSPGHTRALALAATTLLCGGATAVAGPIGFLGLAVPHAARAICGPRLGWVVAYSSLLGPILLVTADVLGRLLARPGEIEVAIVMGAIGAPVFIALVRARRIPRP
ncbi:FecCD family ABC transporter permease [Micromonospora carbonacea]|uniref:Iron ABC transporter permease n=1 Tax=Micromonospora carbonacea TaxID=47853 RepID=A0A7H8XHF3_9ACTN|nr:iron ABC transporter permease [Micromonospora carbonacea]MBB5829510.1 iron complex transport system permease protein [Micromonospora carbonacea]QLD23071.1 iron ABC transporter permease [Micromonospora carbonacea]